MSQLPTNPNERLALLADHLRAAFAGQGAEVVLGFGEVTLVVGPADWRMIAARLQADPDFAFDTLVDVCGLDMAAYGRSEWATAEASHAGFGRGIDRDVAAEHEGPRFCAVYHLLSVTNNQRLRVRVMLPGDPPVVPSVVDIWKAADWFEREAFDLFGILFDGHPDLRRILTDYGFIGHPFRKDFPLIGHVEMRYDPEKGRVVYEPVTIEQRPHVPRVVREDGYAGRAR